MRDVLHAGLLILQFGFWAMHSDATLLFSYVIDLFLEQRCGGVWCINHLNNDVRAVQ